MAKLQLQAWLPAFLPPRHHARLARAGDSLGRQGVAAYARSRLCLRMVWGGRQAGGLEAGRGRRATSHQSNVRRCMTKKKNSGAALPAKGGGISKATMK